MAEFPRIFSTAIVKVSRRVTDVLGTKWMSILEELDEQLNLKISFTKRSHVLEGQWCDIIKAHNLILHQLELMNVTLPEQSSDFSTLQSGSFLNASGINDESDSCRLSLQSSCRSSTAIIDGDLTPRVSSGRDPSNHPAARPQSSTPINSMQMAYSNQSHQSLFQEAKIPVPKVPVATEVAAKSMLQNDGILAPRGLSDDGEGVRPKYHSPKKVPGNTSTVERMTDESDVFSTECTGYSHILGKPREEEPQKEVARLPLMRQKSNESFASSMPSLERATSPGAENSYGKGNLQENDFQPERLLNEVIQDAAKDDRTGDVLFEQQPDVIEKMKIGPDKAGKRDDIEASLLQLENEYKNAKRQSSEDEEGFRENEIPEMQSKVSKAPDKVSGTSSTDQSSMSFAVLNSTPETDPVNAETTYVDTNTWEFMKKANTTDLEAITERYKVSFTGDSNGSDLCSVTITPRAKDANVKRAQDQFTDLYEQTMENCVQYPLKVASQVPDDKIKRAIARISEIYPHLVITPNMGNSRELTFICRSMIIKEIADNFRELIGMIPPRDLPQVPQGATGMSRGSLPDRDTGYQQHYEARTKPPAKIGGFALAAEGKTPIQKGMVQKGAGYESSDISDDDDDDDDIVVEGQVQKADQVVRTSEEAASEQRQRADDKPIPRPEVEKSTPDILQSDKADQTAQADRRPTFNVAEEIRTIELSKSQSPSLQLLYELLMQEDPSNEIQAMTDKILNGEAVDDTGSGYFQSGLYTGDPTEVDSHTKQQQQQEQVDEGKPHQRTEDSHATSEDSDSSDLYGNFQHSPEHTRRRSRSKSDVEEVKVVSPPPTKDKRDIVEDSSDDDLYIDSPPKLHQKPNKPAAAAIPKSSTNFAKPSQKDRSIPNPATNQRHSKPHAADTDSSNDSSSDGDDLYGDFKKSVHGISQIDSYGMLMTNGPQASTKAPMVSSTGQAKPAQGVPKQTSRSSETRGDHSNTSSLASSVSEAAGGGEPEILMKLPVLPAGYQPKDGDMHLLIDKKYDIPGHEHQGGMVVTFNFEDGEQDRDGPRPGAYYKGIRVAALIPNSVEGKAAYKGLKKAFDQRKLFTTEINDTTTYIVPRIAMKGKRADYPELGYVEALKASLETIVDG